MTSVKQIVIGNNGLSYKINNNQEINRITLLFNQKDMFSNNDLKNGEVTVNFESIQDLNGFLILFSELLKNISKENKININLKINFVIKKEQEPQIKQIIEILKQNNMNNCSMELLDEYERRMEQENNNVSIKKENPQNLVAKVAKEIFKQGPNGENLKYIEFKGVIYEDNLGIGINNEMNNLLLKLMENPEEQNKISNMSKEEFQRLCENLMTSVLKDRKPYYLETSDKITDNGKNKEQANITKNLTEENEGRGNAELGITEKGVDKTNSYANEEFVLVEQNNKTGNYDIATSEVKEQTINQNGVTSSNLNSNIYYNSYDPNNGENYNETINQSEELTPRELEQEVIYYIDESENIYTKRYGNDEDIGQLNDEQGYYLDEEGNLYKNNEKLGKTEKREKVKVKTLTKDSQNNYGYISFMLISIVISILFLIYIVITLI